MKKILFLQINGRSFGGVWLVNKTLGEEFIKRGYKVSLACIRNNHPGTKEEKIDEFTIHTINPVDKWQITHKRDLLNALKQGPVKFIKILINYINDHNKLKRDYKKMQEYISCENPDYIIASHYQTLPGIPKEYLNRTVHVQHSAFMLVDQDKKNAKTLKKYNKKLNKLVWLSESSKKEADKRGFINNHFIYNPVRIDGDVVANVKDNKRLVTLSRFAPEKRIDLMIDIVNDVFKNKKYKDWTFYLYGKGELSEKSLKIIEESNQIFNKGVISNPKEALISASCSLNTSIFEGFPLSIVESFTCGVPAITFDYGESAYEQINDGVDGFVIKQNDIDEYKNKLERIMSDENILKTMAKNAKESSKKYEINNIVNEWEKLFKEMG